MPIRCNCFLLIKTKEKPPWTLNIHVGITVFFQSVFIEDIWKELALRVAASLHYFLLNLVQLGLEPAALLKPLYYYYLL